MIEVEEILKENERRKESIERTFNPITGEGAILERRKVEISDFPTPTMYLPLTMFDEKFINDIVECGSIAAYISKYLSDIADTEDDVAVQKVIETFIRIRIRHDFCFWAAFFIYIKSKGGGDDILFRLNRPQRRLIEAFEKKRLANMPIRLILLKARQWGGSTATQIYMAWLQLTQSTGLNSLIVGHVKDSSTEVKAMFEKMLDKYPLSMLYEMGESYDARESKITNVGNTGNIKRVPQRNCNIKIGSAEVPDSARGGDYNLVHCTEVGLWKKTDGKTPEDIVQAACSGIALKPLTMIVYESTAKGTGNFFHREYQAAKDGISQFECLFIAWFDIDLYTLPLANEREFAEWLYINRKNENAPSEREECGKYLWWLWERGATLQAINWYITERKSRRDHAIMASEYPSDDIEAFQHSGERVFDRYQVEELRKTCKPPLYIGDVYGDDIKGKNALKNVRFKEDHQGVFWVWALPEIDEEYRVTDRYAVSVDIGGVSDKADWSVIRVIDRFNLMDGGKMAIVAQWRGHTYHDLLAIKAAQIAAFYDNALLIIESNTLETKDKERYVDGDQSSYILDEISSYYDNLYARKQSPEDIVKGLPKKWGWHTNVQSKPMIISNLQMLIREQAYIERDEYMLDELLCYERKANGSLGAIDSKHDDEILASAIGLYVALKEMELPKIVRKTTNHVKVKKAISEASF